MNNYTSLKELYLKLIPSFKVKLRLLRNTNDSYLTKKDIWSYLQSTKWKYDIGLTVADMITDIINVDEGLIAKYMEEEK